MATRREKRQQAKKKEREKRVATIAHAERVSEKLLIALDEVDERISRRDFSTALEILNELEVRWPNHRLILSQLVNLYRDLGDIGSMEKTAERWARVSPNDPDVIAQWSWSLGMAGMPALAKQAIRQFLERWPDHSLSVGMRDDILVKCQEQALDLIRSLGLNDDEHGWRVVETHERIFQATQRSEIDRVIQLGEAALRDQIFVTAIFNNLSEAYFHSARLPEALLTAQRAAEFAPTNLTAQFNVVRFLLLLGRREEAHRTADVIRSIRPTRFDFWGRLVATFVLLERYDEALQVAADAKSFGEHDGWKTPDAAELHHATAVALANRNRISEAETEWRSALKVRLGYAWAQVNLDDLRQPVGQRNGPFLYPFANLVPRKLIDQLGAYLKQLGHVSNDEHSLAMRRYCEEHPGLQTAIPVLLGIGDDAAREVGMTFAKLIRTPELLDALRDFALGNRGTDKRRMNAIQLLREVGAELAQPIRFFSNGAWTEIQTLGIEVTGEAIATVPAHVQPQMDRGHAALQRGDFHTGERCFREVIAAEPTLAAAHNNLAVSLLSQNRDAEAEPILRHVLTFDENNAIARCHLAKLALLNDDENAAVELLKPLRCPRKFHFTEFAAMTAVDIELTLRKGNIDSAKEFLKSLEKIYPASANLPMLRSMIRRAEHEFQS